MHHPLDLSGKTILITGASGGIGRSASVLMSRLGGRVIVTGRHLAALEQTAAAMSTVETKQGCHRVSAFDLARLEEIPAWLAALVEEAGPLDALVHCAGVASLLPLRSLRLEHLEEAMRVNFYAAAVLTREFARKRTHHEGASIVFVASVAGTLGTPGRAAYSASKGALIAFAKSAAIELAKSGIRVNCIAPSYVRTDMYEKTMVSLTPEQIEARLDATQPLGLGTPEDVAGAIAFLVAGTGRWITGSVLAVDGGYAAQ
jgi:NAD(P)-dependent dehydrogenase (short-subunit alcohol dehydrogenase family)